MSKIIRISDLQHQFSFLNPSENFDIYFNQFLLSDLGKIYTAIPWDALVTVFKIKESIQELLQKNDFDLEQNSFISLSL